MPQYSKDKRESMYVDGSQTPLSSSIPEFETTMPSEFSPEPLALSLSDLVTTMRKSEQCHNMQEERKRPEESVLTSTSKAVTKSEMLVTCGAERSERTEQPSTS